MKFLGIDYGSKRVGVALSDEDGRIAFPLATLPNNSNLIKEIEKICKERGVGAIVLGESLDYKGKPNQIQSAIANCKLKIEKFTGLAVVYQQEFLTSKQAERSTTKASADASAAALILQGYLDKGNRI